MKRYSVHKFSSIEDIPFSKEDYSRLKHGSNIRAKKFGIELANAFFRDHAAEILSHQVLVMESSYAFVRNAAALLTDHFTDQMNILIAESNGHRCQRTKINRCLPYISDYGKLDAAQRHQLLDMDTFTFDSKYAHDKMLIFIDDVIITGTHEMKIKDMLRIYGLDSPLCYALYYAEFDLAKGSAHPSIESHLNNNRIYDLDTLMEVVYENDSELIVRPLKMILGWEDEQRVTELFEELAPQTIRKMYLNCVGEGYHQNPAYSRNFSNLRDRFVKKFQ